MPPRLFTLEEAKLLLPSLEPLMRRLAQKRQALRVHQEVLEEFRATAGKSGGGMPGGRFGEARIAAERLTGEIEEAVRRVETWGCMIKDLDQGLVDFPSRRAGEPVLLCWRLGEPSIQYWHGLEEGFAGRKPLEDSAEQA
jgi:hypothetical protein